MLSLSGTRQNPAQVQQDASSLAQAGYYAVGLLKQFAGHVDEGVEDLNRRLRSDAATAQRSAERSADYNDEGSSTAMMALTGG